MITSNFRKVIDFNNYAGYHPFSDAYQETIFVEKLERVELKFKLIQKKTEELYQAVKNQNFFEVIDSLTHLLYVVYDSGAEFGIDLDKSFDIVHKSNMTKFCISQQEAIDTVHHYLENLPKNGKSIYKNP